MLGIRWEKGKEPRPAAASKKGSAAFTYQGGKIMPSVTTKAIFWGPSWANASFVGDKIGGLDAWYAGWSNDSLYAQTGDEWTDTVNGGHIVGSAANTYQGFVVDLSTPSSNSSKLLAEVCSLAAAGKITLDPSGNGYYPIYTDIKPGGYCAYHSFGTCTVNGTSIPVQFGFFFNTDASAGCSSNDLRTAQTNPPLSFGLASLADSSAHEISEARSDPASPGAWRGPSGAEVGDVCTSAYNVDSSGIPVYVSMPPPKGYRPPPSAAYPSPTNHYLWHLQGEWSNLAYAAGQAGSAYSNGSRILPDNSGVPGCIDGDL
jgi:hypothetical protein